MVGVFKAVTGWDYSWKDMRKTGERIVKHAARVQLREGINELDWAVPRGSTGNPPQTAGPLAGLTADIDAQVTGLGYLDWDRSPPNPVNEIYFLWAG